MIINHNLNALNAHRNIGINNTAAGKAMEKLSSGLRIKQSWRRRSRTIHF